MLVAAPLAHAQTPSRQLTVTPASPATWEGDQATGANANYDFDAGEPCEDPQDTGAPPDPTTYCDRTLLFVDAGTFFDTHAGGVEIRIGDYSPNPASDFDLQVFRSDASGTRGRLVGASAGAVGEEEATTIEGASGYYLVQVVYFAVTQSRYTGTAKFISRAKVPPDVDQPPGLQDSLASDPGLGFRSHSEPHMAQSPTDRNLLIAGSKMYNRDPDSLAEYEFKVGTYVSFDRGRTWHDLGQTAVCPAARAGPETWPDNECYPDEDPAKGGTGDEDVNDPADPEDEFDSRGDGDFGEEYIVSDPWIQFDDEGNAYLMVLDSPPFESGVGWGMTLHRWRTPSPEDLQPGGRTWSDRIPINAYGSPVEQELFLDDKNTFAVNNAGRDGDGDVGVMVACWGQNLAPAPKQQIVCERSTDGGMSWPEPPAPISDVQPLVIGVHVFADPEDPRTFYATWLQYATELALGQATLEFARSTDGGRTWARSPQPATTLTGLPTTYPGQAFRNLSIPIMAAAPGGHLYIAYAEYVDATEPAQDEDGREGDIRLLRSSDGGASWSDPMTVSEEGPGTNVNADQFQPTVAVTPSGQVNVAYFDRRHDLRVTSGSTLEHPGNFFIDTYLSRSNDRGGSFQSVRVSHDMWDPTINPPISGSGEFIGDYQGLAADDCFAIPFFNDTHLANDAAREPGFDTLLPRTEFQQVFSWRVPNTSEFGGQAVPAANCTPAPQKRRNACRPIEGAILGTGKSETLRGTKGPDLILAGRGRDKVKGFGGDDILCGGKGTDAIRGGEGADLIRGHADGDRLAGNVGEDRVIGGKDRDRVRGNAGDDKLTGNRGPDSLRAGAGADRLRGNNGDDDLDGGGGRDMLHGNKGDDRLRGAGGADRCRGGSGDDAAASCRGG